MRRANHSLAVQAIALAVGNGLAQVVVAALYAIAARGSLPVDFGVVVTAIGIGQVAAGFIDFGTSALWVRELASGRLTHREIANRASTKVMIAAALCAVVAAGLALTGSAAFAPAAVICTLTTTSMTVQVPLQAAKRAVSVASLFVIERLAAAALFGVIAATMGTSPSTALWLGLCGGTCASIGLGMVLTSRDERILLAPTKWILPWAGSAHYGFTSLAASAQQLDLAVLSAVGGAAAAGQYGAVNRWTQPMGLLANAFSRAAVPYVAQAQDWRTVFHLVTRSVWMLGCAIAVCVAMVIAAPWIVPLLLGSDYAHSVAVLQWLAAGTIPAIINQPLAGALQARQRENVVAVVFGSAVILQLCVVAALGGIVGALGAAIAYCLLQLLLLASLSVVTVVFVRSERVEVVGVEVSK